MFNKQPSYVHSGFYHTLGFIDTSLLEFTFASEIEFMRLKSQNVIVNSAQGEALGLFQPITDC